MRWASPLIPEYRQTGDGDRPRVVATTLDLESATGRVVRSDGKEATVPLDALRLEATDRIARITHIPDLNAVLYVTIYGHDIMAELPSLSPSSTRDGRIVVYLDQKDWRTLRNARYESDAVNSEERDAAETLIGLVESRKVILPMSSGHMTETTKWSDGILRYQLALTVLQFSRGWQMRDPLAIREGEVRAALTHRGQVRDLGVPNVFTLEPNAALAGRRDDDVVPAGREVATAWLPPEFELSEAALTALSSYFAVMLDAEHVPAIAIPGWEHRQQVLTDTLASNRPSRPQADAMIDQFFIEDTAYEIERAARKVGISRSQLRAWKELGAARDVPRMPSLSLFREVLRERHLNPRTRWRQNDLVDAAYLTCGAAYADHVVAERHFTAQLRKAAARLGRQLNIHRNLRELIPHLSS